MKECKKAYISKHAIMKLQVSKINSMSEKLSERKYRSKIV